MPRIDSKRLPFSSKGHALMYSIHLWSMAMSMADIVTEQWIQIQRLEQALHITQILTFDHALLFAERKKKKEERFGFSSYSIGTQTQRTKRQKKKN
ncbi:unnamed protein product [Prunus armeniaca]